MSVRGGNWPRCESTSLHTGRATAMLLYCGSLLVIVATAALVEACVPIYPGCVCSTTNFTCSDYASIRQMFVNEFAANLPYNATTIKSDPARYSYKAGRFKGGIVRLAFHDASEYNCSDPDVFGRPGFEQTGALISQARRTSDLLRSWRSWTRCGSLTATRSAEPTFGFSPPSAQSRSRRPTSELGTRLSQLILDLLATHRFTARATSFSKASQTRRTSRYHSTLDASIE